MNEEKFCRRCDEPVEDRIPGCPLQCGSERCSSYKQKYRPDFSRKIIIWVMGGPASGKNTQCIMIADKYKYTRVDVGELIKLEAAKGGNRTTCLLDILEHYELVPTDLVLSLIMTSMAANEKSKGFVIEGFPREVRQGVAFEKTIGQAAAIIFLEASRDTLYSRLKASAGKKAGVASASEIENVIKMRLNTFGKNIGKLMTHYADRVNQINCEQQNEATVFMKAQQVIDAAKLKKSQKKLISWDASSKSSKSSVTD